MYNNQPIARLLEYTKSPQYKISRRFFTNCFTCLH